MSRKKENNRGNPQALPPTDEGQAPQAAPDQEAEAPPEIQVDRAAPLAIALARAGTLDLSPEERRGLSEPFPADAIRQRRLKARTEDYIPHILISRRLNTVLGAGQWCLVRLRDWIAEDGRTIYGSYCLVVRGVWIGDTVAGWPLGRGGESNDDADALEATRGVALRRIAAKSLGVGDQVWIPAEGEASEQPGKAISGPANGRQAPPVGKNRLAELHEQGRVRAAFGTAQLSEWWGSLTREERIALASAKDKLKAAAAQADSDNEAAGHTFN